jgi:ABC-2 type transport system ATP-binding protein
MIAAHALTKRFRRTIGVDSLSLEVGPGEIVALVGPNGAGKSTALRLLCGQLLPDAGRVSVAGVDLLREPLAAKRHIGYVAQEPTLYPYLTGEEVLRFIARVRRAGSLDAAIAACDLGPALRRLTREYSFGMQKRLAFAAAIASAPPVLLLDEIFAGLDPGAVDRFASLLRNERARGAAILFSGHELETVAAIATRVVLLVAGRAVHTFDEDTLATLRDTPGTLAAEYRARVATACAD